MSQSQANTFFAPIVGMVFRPPAGQVLGQLPSGTELELRRQPENPHDSNAIQIFLHGFSLSGPWKEIFQDCWQSSIPDSAEKGKGQWYESDLTDPLFLGYVAAKSGEAEILAAEMDSRQQPTCLAKLGFFMDGKARVEVEHSDRDEKVARTNPDLDDEMPF